VTNIELKVALKSLEARVAELEKRPLPVAQVAAPSPVARQALQKLASEQPKESSRKMCQHCNEKPNHFFHVQMCAKNKKKINGEKDSPS
jgi:hypothetical protein